MSTSAPEPSAADAAGQGFPRQARLLRPQQFDRAFKGGRRDTGGLFRIVVAPGENTSDGLARLGFALARKQVDRAVDRNLLKRLIRESFRHARHRLPPCDLVVTAKQKIRAPDRAQVTEELALHWARIAKKWSASSSS